MNEPSLQQEPNTEEQNALSVIRTETALSRFPIHCLTKGEVRIELKNQAGALFWQVSHSNIHGQPGPLAYKLDTLVINQALEKAGRPLPRLLKLGSLSEICRQMGVADGGKQKADVRKALLQNAFAGITARIVYRTTDRAERSLEAAFTRYAVIFTGENLPDGRRADAVYLMLNDIYVEVLNAALTRPLDYEYMRVLPPMAQRFYEIVSYQIYAALRFGNERARLRYSEYCLLSTATRYREFDQMKKQMYKVHRPHLASGYLGKVNFEATVDEAGEPDWMMFYVPGPNAAREYREFTGIRLTERRRPRLPHRSKTDAAPDQALSLPFQDEAQFPAAKEPKAAQDIALIAALVDSGLNRVDAENFSHQYPDECRRQLEYLPYMADFKTSRGAYLRRAIEQGYGPPPGYEKARVAEDARRRKEEQVAQENARKTAQKARRAMEDQTADSELIQLEKDAPEAYNAFERFVAGERAKEEEKFRTFTPTIQERMGIRFASVEKRRELFRQWKASSSLTEKAARQVAQDDLFRDPIVELEKPAVLIEETPEAIARLVRDSLRPNT